MRTTLRDVAELAGVSPKTVSNVVNGYVHVSKATRERVEQAISELKYRPNLSARSLRQGRTGVIALAVPELNVPYFAELARHLVTAAAERGWTVLIDQTGGVRERERQAIEGIRGQLIDGLVLSPLALASADLTGRADTTPLVLLGERIARGPADHVAIDNVEAAREATSYLVAMGRARIAAVGEQHVPAGQTAKLRLKGYHQALSEAGRAYDRDLVVSAEAFHRADGAAAMEALLALESPPDAVFCFNDLLALGALRVLQSRGVRVPDDIALIGFDDIEEGQYSWPSLSTVAPDKEQIARLALERLDRQLSGEPAGPGGDGEPEEILAGHRLVRRETTEGV